MYFAGQERREFTVYEQEIRGTDKGREGLVSGYREIGKIQAVLAQANSEEVQRWRLKQLNHPVSHKIIMRGTPEFDVKPGYIFKSNGIEYFITALPYNPGNIGHWTIFYCNDRRDVRN
jgi:hypothetical protein